MSRITKHLWVAAVWVAAGCYYTLKEPTREEVATKAKLSEQTLKAQRFAELTKEAFAFKKSAKVSFDFSQEPIEQIFKGTLFLNWYQDASGTKIAIASIDMAGQTKNVHIRAQFEQAFKIKCIEVPKLVDEEEADSVLLLKNLLLDYAYKTNQDENGEYRAIASTKVLPNGISEITKVKTEYIDAKKKELKIINSRHEIKTTGHILAASGEETFELTYSHGKGEDKKNVSAQLGYELTALTSNVTTPKLDQTKEFSECSSDFAQEAVVASRVPTHTFRETLRRVSEMDRSARQDEMRKILKALRGNPELLSEFMGWTNGILTDRKLSAYALGILGSLGTPAAQKELVSLFSSATTETKHLHQQILNTFTLTDAALTSESRAFLKGLLNSDDAFHVEGAAYALGSSIGNDPGGSESKENRQLLVQGLENSQDAKTTITYLDALANSADPNLLPVFEKYASSSDESVRAKSLSGLRGIADEKRLGILKRALSDQSQRVRKVAEDVIKSIQL